MENASTIRYWKALQTILLQVKPVCMVIHAVVETHEPYLSADITNPILNFKPFKDDFHTKEAIQQKKISEKYWNAQLEFYDSFFKEYDCTRVFMSDHGRWHSKEDRRYFDYVNHIFFFIIDKKMKPKRINNLFSLFDFDKVIAYILQPSVANLNNILSDVILLQDVDIYSFSKLQYLDNSNKELAMSYRSARGKNDKYVLLRNGEEKYYLLPDEKNNHINEKVYKERILELKKLAGSEFLNLNSSERFYYARELYEKGIVKKI